MIPQVSQIEKKNAKSNAKHVSLQRELESALGQLKLEKMLCTTSVCVRERPNARARERESAGAWELGEKQHHL